MIDQLISKLDGAFVKQMVAYRNQANTILLGGDTETAKILAHKAEAFREASQILLTVGHLFEEEEEQ